MFNGDMDDASKIRFHEIQHVSATPVMLIPIGLLVFSVWGLFHRSHAESIMVMGFAVTFSAFLTWVYFKFALRVTIDDKRLLVEYLPTSQRPVHLADIVNVEQVVYSPLKNFGWGRKGDAWTVSGRAAIKVTLRTGGHIVIGTRKPDELLQALLEAVDQGNP